MKLSTDSSNIGLSADFLKQIVSSWVKIILILTMQDLTQTYLGYTHRLLQSMVIP